MERNIIKRVRMVRMSRKKHLVDRFLIKMFPKTFNRWCDRHLGYAYNDMVISSEQLHSLDYQLKTDLKRPGFPKI